MDSELSRLATSFAEAIRQELSINYDLQGINFLEEHINKNREYYENLEDEQKKRVAYKIGSFVGCCMVQNYNGVWENHEDGLGVRLGKNIAFPLLKTWKFLSKDGIYDSISSFYEVSAHLDKIMDKEIGEEQKDDPREIRISKSQNKKKWWKFW